MLGARQRCGRACIHIEKVWINEVPEKEPTGISTMDVVEFYNNSALEVSEEETVLKTSVQDIQITLNWRSLADTFELPTTGSFSKVPSYPDDVLEVMYNMIKNFVDPSSPKDFHTNSCRWKHVVDVYNNVGLILSKCVDCQKGSLDQFSRRRWSMIKLIHDMSSGNSFQLNWAKVLLEIITTAAKNFKAICCLEDDDSQ